MGPPSRLDVLFGAPNIHNTLILSLLDRWCVTCNNSLRACHRCWSLLSKMGLMGGLQSWTLEDAWALAWKRDSMSSPVWCGPCQLYGFSKKLLRCKGTCMKWDNDWSISALAYVGKWQDLWWQTGHFHRISSRDFGVQCPRLWEGSHTFERLWIQQSIQRVKSSFRHAQLDATTLEFVTVRSNWS